MRFNSSLLLDLRGYNQCRYLTVRKGIVRYDNQRGWQNQITDGSNYETSKNTNKYYLISL